MQMRPIKFGLMMSNQQYQIYLVHRQIPFAADPFRNPSGCKPQAPPIMFCGSLKPAASYYV